MARRSLYEAYDRLLDGKLAAELLRFNAEGETLDGIAYRMRNEHDIIISSETVRRWLADAKAADEVKAS